MGHWVDTFVIIGVAVINALIGFIQENNAEKSLKSIQNMLASEAMLVRDGKQVTVATRDLGDHLRDQITLLDLNPRQLMLAEEFLGCFADQARRKPASLAGRLVATGFADRVRGNALDR